MRVFLSALLALSLFVAVTSLAGRHEERADPSLYRYVVENFEDDCATTNAVTSILLNYRMYDTMFEVLILLTAIVGMRQFLPAPHELADADEGGARGGRA